MTKYHATTCLVFGAACTLGVLHPVLLYFSWSKALFQLQVFCSSREHVERNACTSIMHNHPSTSTDLAGGHQFSVSGYIWPQVCIPPAMAVCGGCVVSSIAGMCTAYIASRFPPSYNRVMYGTQLEHGQFAANTADYVWMYCIGALTCLVCVRIVWVFEGSSTHAHRWYHHWYTIAHRDCRCSQSSPCHSIVPRLCLC